MPQINVFCGTDIEPGTAGLAPGGLAALLESGRRLYRVSGRIIQASL